MTPSMKLAQSIVLENGAVGECRCDMAYKGRGLTDPSCPWCEWGLETRNDIAQALDRQARLIALLREEAEAAHGMRRILLKHPAKPGGFFTEEGPLTTYDKARQARLEAERDK